MSSLYLKLLGTVAATGMLVLGRCYPVRADDWACLPDRSDPPTMGLKWEDAAGQPTSYEIFASIGEQPEVLLQTVEPGCNTAERGCLLPPWELDAVYRIVARRGDKWTSSPLSQSDRVWPNVARKGKVGFTAFVAALFGPMDLGAVMYLYGAELTVEGEYIK